MHPVTPCHNQRKENWTLSRRMGEKSPRGLTNAGSSRNSTVSGFESWLAASTARSCLPPDVRVATEIPSCRMFLASVVHSAMSWAGAIVELAAEMWRL